MTRLTLNAAIRPRRMLARRALRERDRGSTCRSRSRASVRSCVSERASVTATQVMDTSAKALTTIAALRVDHEPSTIRTPPAAYAPARAVAPIGRYRRPRLRKNAIRAIASSCSQAHRATTAIANSPRHRSTPRVVRRRRALSASLRYATKRRIVMRAVLGYAVVRSRRCSDPPSSRSSRGHRETQH
jgi:hypothetical protein